MRKLLIIKLGYSETLDNALNLTTSMGDVLRTTFLLHFFKNWHITWLVDKRGVPLLENNKYIDRISIYSPQTVSCLQQEKFNYVINFEKLPCIYNFLDSLDAERYLGFYLERHSRKGDIFLNKNKQLFEISGDVNKRKENRDCWQKILAQAIGKEWKGEEYILGYKPKSKEKYDIGFNWTTSEKWKNKAWPKPYWEELEGLIRDKYSISWQEGFDDLYQYFEWINSCRLIVTADTLGLHLGLALKKRVIALFGPIAAHEIYFYNRGSFLLPRVSWECLPCFVAECDKEKQCMEYIFPQKVKEKIEYEFKKCLSSSKV